jgi:hypothetical protein
MEAVRGGAGEAQGIWTGPSGLEEHPGRRDSRTASLEAGRACHVVTVLMVWLARHDLWRDGYDRWDGWERPVRPLGPSRAAGFEDRTAGVPRCSRSASLEDRPAGPQGESGGAWGAFGERDINRWYGAAGRHDPGATGESPRTMWGILGLGLDQAPSGRRPWHAKTTIAGAVALAKSSPWPGARHGVRKGEIGRHLNNSTLHFLEVFP